MRHKRCMVCGKIGHKPEMVRVQTGARRAFAWDGVGPTCVRRAYGWAHPTCLPGSLYDRRSRVPRRLKYDRRKGKGT